MEDDGEEGDHELSNQSDSSDASLLDRCRQPDGEESDSEDGLADLGGGGLVSESSGFAPSDDEESAPSVPNDDSADLSEEETGETAERKGKQGERPSKRAASLSVEDGQPRSKKRRKDLNANYVNLLNEDIEHAVSRYIPEERPTLQWSQMGLTVWTRTEKEIFFESLCRLGQDDLGGITERIKTKSLVEVRRYMLLLQEYLAKREKHDDHFKPLQLVDFPAAIEVSEEVTQALDKEAEALAARLAKQELAQERARWGDLWLISPSNCNDVIETAGEGQIPFVEFFNLENWLTLSERCFMNSSQADGSWQSFGDLPSIQATTWEDFYALADIFTRRLLSATLYISMSRIRSKRVPASRATRFVRKKDVEAAVASLGLPTDKRLFWVGVARRHGLAVHETLNKKTRQGEGDPLAYAEVERALSVGTSRYEAPYSLLPPDPPLSGEEDMGDSEDSEDSVVDSQRLVQDVIPGVKTNEDDAMTSTSEMDPETHQEALEVTRYSAMGFPRTTRAYRALMTRIKAEREEEEYADWVDGQASRDLDARIWANVLDREPPERLAKLEARLRPQKRGTLADLHRVGRNWRDKITYVSEWEAGWDDAGREGGPAAGPSEADRARM